MNEGRYNIPRQYKVDKGMPLEALFQRIENPKCRRIFEAEVECVTWKYHIVDKEGISSIAELVKERGLSVFEVSLKRKIAPDLLTEVFAGLNGARVSVQRGAFDGHVYTDGQGHYRQDVFYGFLSV